MPSRETTLNRDYYLYKGLSQLTQKELAGMATQSAVKFALPTIAATAYRLDPHRPQAVVRKQDLRKFRLIENEEGFERYKSFIEASKYPGKFKKRAAVQHMARLVETGLVERELIGSVDQVTPDDGYGRQPNEDGYLYWLPSPLQTVSIEEVLELTGALI